MPGITDCERQFHIQTLPEEVGRYVILAGDPARVPLIARLLEGAAQVAYNREFNVYSGTLEGERVTVCSTGIGGASTAIAVEELIKCGADTFIRVGTCGGIADKVRGGDLVIASSAIRAEGTSYEYLPTGYPAAADYDVTEALARAAAALSQDRDGARYHVGVVHSKDSFYGQVETESSPVAYKLRERWQSYIRCGCLSSEMECAALYSVTQARGARGGAVLTAIWNMERSHSGVDDTQTLDSSRAIRCAVEAVRLLIKESGKNG
ncbi:MAG: nucleoside phosphorylase [Ruminococcus sp.]|nr:nucleoside phosphorylase [Ruminococcus sp.]